MLNGQHGNALNIYPSIQIPHSGIAYRWEVLCSQNGKMVLDVWRPLGGGSFQLIGKNIVPCSADIKKVITSFAIGFSNTTYYILK